MEGLQEGDCPWTTSPSFPSLTIQQIMDIQWTLSYKCNMPPDDEMSLMKFLYFNSKYREDTNKNQGR